MKNLKKITATILCFTLILISPISTLAAEQGSWNITGSPYVTAPTRTITLDYSSHGYKAYVSVLEGTSSHREIQISSSSYNPSLICSITYVRNYDIPKPDTASGVVSFVVRLVHGSDGTAHSEGYIKRKTS